MSSAEDNPQATIAQYRAKACEAKRMAEKSQDTLLVTGWERVAKLYDELADSWERQQRRIWNASEVANRNVPDH
jgi:hypothetical protein